MAPPKDRKRRKGRRRAHSTLLSLTAPAVPPRVGAVGRQDQADSPPPVDWEQVFVRYYDRSGPFPGTFRVRRVTDVLVTHAEDDDTVFAVVNFEFEPVEPGSVDCRNYGASQAEYGVDCRTAEFAREPDGAGGEAWDVARLGGYNSGRRRRASVASTATLPMSVPSPRTFEASAAPPRASLSSGTGSESRTRSSGGGSSRSSRTAASGSLTAESPRAAARGAAADLDPAGSGRSLASAAGVDALAAAAATSLAVPHEAYSIGSDISTGSSVFPSGAPAMEGDGSELLHIGLAPPAPPSFGGGMAGGIAGGSGPSGARVPDSALGSLVHTLGPSAARSVLFGYDGALPAASGSIVDDPGDGAGGDGAGGVVEPSDNSALLPPLRPMLSRSIEIPDEPPAPLGIPGDSGATGAGDASADDPQFSR